MAMSAEPSQGPRLCLLCESKGVRTVLSITNPEDYCRRHNEDDIKRHKKGSQIDTPNGYCRPDIKAEDLERWVSAEFGVVMSEVQKSLKHNKPDNPRVPLAKGMLAHLMRFDLQMKFEAVAGRLCYAEPASAQTACIRFLEVIHLPEVQEALKNIRANYPPKPTS